MPKLNRVLISSVLCQVEELVSLSMKISSLIDKKVDLSRKHAATATINSETIETLKDYKGTAGEMYILLLELAYDRINFVMGLMIGFVEQRSGLESHERDYEETLTSLVCVEGHATVATTAKLLWRRLEALPDTGEINSRYAKHVALFDEYKIAVGHRLAAMAEGKLALEKTLVETRKDIIDRRATGNLAESPRRSPSRTTRGTQTTSEAEMTRDEVTMGKMSAQCVSPLHLITPDDDPVMDMSREMLSNEKKIDDLLRQNERLSRALVRIAQYNNNNNSDTKPSD